MATFLLAFVIFGTSLAGLALGVMTGRGPIRGSCGELACRTGAECSACSHGYRRTG